MPSFDIAVFGTNLLSGLLAGMLARDHGKRVVRIGRRPSAQRLPRAINLALPLATHPESWRLLRQAEGETRALLAAIGVPDTVSTTEIEFVAELPDTAEALDHMAHLALGHGHQIRRTERGWAFRHAAQLHPELIEDRLAEWLSSVGVTSIEEAPGDAVQTILADDAALLEQLPEHQRPAQLVSEAMTATLVVAPRGLAVPIRRYPDRGVTLLRHPGNAVLALISGDIDVEARLASVLTGPFPMKRLATTHYRRVVSADAAPLVGRAKPSKQFVIAGLGDAASFMAPSLARFIAGASNPDEKRWFASHDPARPREQVAEYAP
jgi:hypothetical protein